MFKAIFYRQPPAPLRALIWLANNNRFLNRLINRTIINSAVKRVRRRPHPFSTAHAFTSWTALSNTSYSSRHLPAAPQPVDPPVAAVTELFRRPPGGGRVCEKSTLLFPCFAQYLTDGFIRTRMPNESKKEPRELRKQNTSNHQIDLCPLYGRIPAHTLALRLRSEAPGERGRLKTEEIGGEAYAPRLFDATGAIRPEFAVLDEPLGLDHVPAENRAALFAFGGDRANATPQVAAMNTLFLREHNRLAGRIEADHPDWNDERVFETTRNCVIVMFIKIVVEEYINHIAPVPFRLSVDPQVAWVAPWNKPNWIAIEFSLLYRWHSLLPDSVEFGGVDVPLARTTFNNRLMTDHGLRRTFASLSAQPAMQVGLLNTADALIKFEERAVDQARLCEVASFRAYCDYFGEAAPETFEAFSTNPDVVAALRRTYRTPADVEFYPGLFAQDRVPGSPLPPLLLYFVAVDAFSQALTNPLLSEHVWTDATFSKVGRETIEGTASLNDILARVSPSREPDFIGMTRPSWS